MAGRNGPKVRPESEPSVNTVIGQAIMSRRTALDLTRTDLAGLCGLPRGALRRIEDGARSVSASELFHIAQALGVRPWDFFADLPGAEFRDSAPDGAEIERLVRSFHRVGDAAVRKRLMHLFQSVSGLPERPA